MAENSWEIGLIEINIGVLTAHSCAINMEFGRGSARVCTAQYFSFYGKEGQYESRWHISCNNGRLSRSPWHPMINLYESQEKKGKRI